MTLLVLLAAACLSSSSSSAADAFVSPPPPPGGSPSSIHPGAILASSPKSSRRQRRQQQQRRRSPPPPPPAAVRDSPWYRRADGDVRCSLAASTSSGDNDDGVVPDPAAELRRVAERLRREAEELEGEMTERRKARVESSTPPTPSDRTTSPPASYAALGDSAWTVSYRFSSDPPPKDGDGDGGGREVPKIRYYSGKVDVLFRADGYTVVQNDDRVGGGIRYSKFWGWDEELSELDNERYLLFSADVSLPPDDPYAANTNADSERVYFNARIVKDLRTGSVSMDDGKVSVKRDVEPPGGFWGVFGGQGILAQFRYVGDFACRPIAVDVVAEEGG